MAAPVSPRSEVRLHALLSVESALPASDVSLLGSIARRVLEQPQLSRFRHLTKVKVQAKLSTHGMEVLTAMGFVRAGEDSGELVLPDDAPLDPLRQIVAALQSRQTGAAVEQAEARRRERAQRGFDDEHTGNTMAAAASPARTAAAASAPLTPLDARSEEQERVWTQARLDKLRGQLAAMQRLQLTEQADQPAGTKRRWQECLKELWQSPPTCRDEALSFLLPTLTLVMQAPTATARSWPLENVLPRLNTVQCGAQFMLSLGFVFAEHSLMLPAATDLSDWPAALSALQARSSQVASTRDHARKRAVEMLAAKAAPSKVQKLQEESAASAAGAEAARALAPPAASALQSLQHDLRAFEHRVDHACAVSGYGIPHCIDLQVSQWSGKDADPKRHFEAPALIDGSGRRWRAYIVKVSENQMAFWLELISKLPAEETVRVTAAFEVLHHSARIPCFRPTLGAAMQVQHLQFTHKQPLLGFAHFCTEQELQTIGALNRTTDKLCLRVELSIQLSSAVKDDASLHRKLAAQHGIEVIDLS